MEANILCGPWRILGRAVLWMVLACAGLIAAVFVLELAAFLFGLIEKRPMVAPTASVLVLAGGVAIQGLLLLGAVRGAHAFGDRGLASGFGNRPITRPRLVAALAALVLSWDIVAIGGVVWLSRQGQTLPGLFPKPDSIAMAVTQGIFVCGLAPLAEEAFFRGWLWTALRRWWGLWPTLLVTGALWLVMHAPDGLWRPLILLPTALLLGLARHYGDSIRASLWLHVLNNGFATLLQTVALLAARPV